MLIVARLRVDVLFEKAEDVVVNVVSSLLRRKTESLGKLSRLLAVVRDLSKDLNQNAALNRGLTIDIRDKDLAVLEAKVADFVVDLLSRISLAYLAVSCMGSAHLLSLRQLHGLALGAVNERGLLFIEELEASENNP